MSRLLRIGATVFGAWLSCGSVGLAQSYDGTQVSSRVIQQCSSLPDGVTVLKSVVLAGICQAPVIRKQGNLIEQRRATAGASRANYWPKLSLSSGADRVSKSVTVPDARYADYRLLGNSAQGAISLDWVLYDSGYTDAKVTSDDALTSAAGHEYAHVVMGVMLDDIAAFYKYMNAADAMSVTRDAVASAEKIAVHAAGKYHAGVGTIADYQFAQANLAQACVKEDEAIRGLDVARTELLTLVGSEFDTSLLDGAIDVHYSFPDLPPVEVLTDRVVAGNAKLQAIDFQMKSTRQRIKAARASALPVVSLEGSRYASRTPPDTSRVEQRIQGWSIGLRLSVPLFDGFESSNNAAAVIAELSGLQNDRASTLRDTRKTADMSYNDVQFGKRQIQSYKILVDHTAASLEAAAARYKAGVGPLTDVLKAESDFFSSSRELARARRLIAESSIRLFIMINGIDALSVL